MKDVINYSQCWEDIDLLYKALQVGEDDSVLSVTSGGDNSISLLLANPARIVAVDMNPRQNFLAELKLQSAIRLPYEKYLAFLGVTPSGNRATLYQKVKPHLSAQAAAWWTNNPNLISKGLIHTGKFENYLNVFRALFLPLVHSRPEINQFLNYRILAEQINYYHSTWNSWRWRMFFKIASGRQLLRRFARQDVMTKQGGDKTDVDYRPRLEKMILNTPLHRNFYMHYCLRGRYGDYLPPYLESTGYKKLRQTDTDKLEFVTMDILNYLQSTPSDSFSKLNLSDTLESLSEKQNKAVWQEIIRVTKNKAVIVYWTNQLTRKPPASMSRQIISYKTKAKQLHVLDRVFFYKNFHIDSINK